jgi:hypothetical protein
MVWARQALTRNVGCPKLREHLGTTMAYTKTSETLSRIRTIPDEAAS